MELKDLKSDLEALRELYGLLQCGGEVANNVVLGERSKFLLKNLLDGATKRVLETHKKIIAAAEPGVCGTSYSSESGKWRGLPELQPSVSSKILKATPHVIRNFTKESNNPAFISSKDEGSPNKLTTHEVISQQSRLTFSLDETENRKKYFELNKQGNMKQHGTARILSKDAKQHGQRCDPLGQAYGDDKKLLGRNEKNMKLLESNETMSQSSICGLQGTPSVVRSVASSSKSVASVDNLLNQDQKEGEAVNNFSKDIDNAVKPIESHIAAWRLSPKLLDATKSAVPHGLCKMPTSVCPMAQAKEHSIIKNELSHVFDQYSDRDELQLIGLVSQRIGRKDDSNGSHHMLGQSENDLLDDITSERRIQRNEIGQTCKHIVRSDSRLNKKIGNWNVIGMVEADGHKQSETTGCYVHGLRIPIKQDDITKRPSVPVKMPYQMPMDSGGKQSTIAKLRPSIPSQSAGSKALSHNKSLAHDIPPEQSKGVMGILQNKILLHQQEPDESSTAGSGSSDSEAYSLTSQDSSTSTIRRLRIPIKQDDTTRRPLMPVKMPYPIPVDSRAKQSTIAKLRPSIPSQSAGSKAFSYKKSLAHDILPEQKKGGMGILRNKILLRQQEPEESSTAGSGSSDSEVYSLTSQDSSSLTSSRFDQGIYEESCSSTRSDCRDVGESGRLYPTRKQKSIRQANFEPEKAEGQRLGRLRRLKNKLGLIFHHHHHHHHHHHPYDHYDSGYCPRGVHTKSMWKPLHRLFHPKNRNEADDDKLRKARASNVPVKHQVGHFHALVEGLMKHFRHSKKSKPSKGGMGWLRNNQRKTRKVKKLHWWQTFQRQGGVKLSNRRRVKMGFMSKKQKLRVPKLS